MIIASKNIRQQDLYIVSVSRFLMQEYNEISLHMCIFDTEILRHGVRMRSVSSELPHLPSML